MALETGEGALLELQAESKRLRDLWFMGINQICSHSGHVPLSIAQKSTVRQLINESHSTVITLKSGALFHNYLLDDKFPARNPIFLWMDTKHGTLGSLYWNAPDSGAKFLKELDKRIQLAHVNEIYSGKKSGNGQQATTAPDQCCFSISTKSASLHLEAPDAQTRDLWVYGLHGILSGNPKMVTKKREKRKKKKREQPVPVEVPVPVPMARQITLEEMMQNGGVFHGYMYGPNKVPMKRGVFMFYDPEACDGRGGLFWLADGTQKKVKDPKRCVSLASITDLYHGKHTELLLSPAAESADEHRCFSIKTTDKVYNLEAITTEQLDRWLEGIATLLQKNGKQVVNVNEDVIDVQAQIESIKEGSEVMLWANAESPGHEKVFLFYREDEDPQNPGHVFWCDPSQKGPLARTSPQQCLDLNALAEIFIGKHTSVFKHAVAATLPTDCLFSFMTGSEEESLNFQAETPEMVGTWTSALRHILGKCGKLIEDVLDSESKRMRIGGGDVYGRFKSGGNFTRYLGTLESCFKQHIRVFFAEEDGTRLGSLYWGEPPPTRRVMDLDFRLPLDQLKEIWIGKQDEIFTSEAARDSPESCAFSLISDLDELHMEAHTAGEVTIWRDFVVKIMKMGGFTVQENEGKLVFLSSEDIEREKERLRELERKSCAGAATGGRRTKSCRTSSCRG